MTLIYAYQDRGTTRDIVIRDADDAVITPGSNDNVRAIIGRLGEAAKLTVTGGSPTDNGSAFDKNFPTNGTNRLRLDASDLAAIEPGVYTLIIDFFDNADSAEWKTVERQVFSLEETT